MNDTATRLDLPATLTALVQLDTAEAIESPSHTDRAYRALATDGSAVEIWFGRAGELRLGELWRRLGWLQGRTTAPRPVAFDTTGEAEVLVIAPLHGRRATDVEYRVDAVRTVGTVGAALAALHGLSIERCPFDADARRLATAATRRLAALTGGWPPGTVDPAVAHVSPERLASVIEDGLDRFGQTEDPVLCHGRPTIDRFFLRDGEDAGIDGWERCGVGDRYLDLSILARSVASSMTPHLVPVLFEGYGLERPDLARLDWFQLIDAAS